MSRPKPLELPVTTATLFEFIRWNCSCPENGEHEGNGDNTPRSRRDFFVNSCVAFVTFVLAVPGLQINSGYENINLLHFTSKIY